MKINNIVAAKELVKRYKTITLEEIEAALLKNKNIVKFALRDLTGFGEYKTCTLCLSADEIKAEFHGTSNEPKNNSSVCYYCVYGDIVSCRFNEFRQSYNNILKAKTPEDILDAYLERAIVLQKLIDKIER